jgi:hypothetical protein
MTREKIADQSNSSNKNIIASLLAYFSFFSQYNLLIYQLIEKLIVISNSTISVNQQKLIVNNNFKMQKQSIFIISLFYIIIFKHQQLINVNNK